MLKKMKICIVSSYYPPHIGGVERYVQNLSKELASKGHEITVVTTNSEGLEPEETIDGILILRFTCLNIAKGRFPFLKKNTEYYQLFTKLKSEKFDAIILNQRFYRITKLAIELSKVTNSPLYLIEHVTGHFTVHNKILDFFGHLYEHNITSYLKENIHKAFGVSKACTRWLEHFGIKSDDVIPNGISKNEIIDKNYNSKMEFDIPENSKIFFHAGRLVAEKGITIMIEAFTDLIEQGLDAYLIISGDGPLLKDNRDIRNDRILATGVLSHDKVMAIISQSDCVVIPSYYPEGLPTLILEAGYCRKPVIATSMGGTTEIIENKINGMIVDPKSKEHLGNAMSYIYSNSEKANVMGEALHQTVVNEYTWDKIANKLIDKIK
jgi:glycosyltransferase involved in cell wall biosynthesis